jgi:hypothetical protein
MGTTCRNHFTSANSRHAGTKAMTALAHELTWLIGPFHGTCSLTYDPFDASLRRDLFPSQGFLRFFSLTRAKIMTISAVLANRRRFFAFGGASIALALAGRSAFAARPPADGIRTITITSWPVARLEIGNAQPRKQKLRFRSGLELRSSYEGFGGFSGLWRSPDGKKLVAVTDAAQWLTADIDTDPESLLTGLSSAIMAPVLNREGKPLRATKSYDTEALTLHEGIAYIGIERTHDVMRFDFAKDGIAARGQAVPVPRSMKTWPSNKGPEILAVAPPASPVAGALMVIAERARWPREAPSQGFLLTGRQRGAFDIARHDGFELTDGAFLDNGDFLLLERHFALLSGVRCRVRRISANSIRPGALLDGDVLFEADSGDQIDNMEGLTLHRNARGETIITLISDDNFSILQRTLLLEFVLV